MPVITLTTDFGMRDWFVGAMKGVILDIHPRATVVDLTHETPPGNIRAGAFSLMAGYRFFPRGTVHVAVVDPGVGSGRGAIAAQTADYVFVGPDNGVLSWALAREKIKTTRKLENQTYFLKPVSHTFHGRDIFAPVAAHLAKGLSCRSLGPEAKDFVRLPWPRPRSPRQTIHGEVIYIDHFGNAITNIPQEMLAGPTDAWRIAVRERIVCPLENFYQAVAAGKSVAYVGSTGLLEIAIHGGRAAEKLRLTIGSKVEVRRTNEKNLRYVTSRKAESNVV